VLWYTEIERALVLFAGDTPYLTQIALPQRHVVALGQINQPLQRAMEQWRIGGMGNGLGLDRVVHHHPLEVVLCQGAGLVRHYQALLKQRDELLLAQAMAPIGQGGAVKPQPVVALV